MECRQEMQSKRRDKYEERRKGKRLAEESWKKQTGKKKEKLGTIIAEKKERMK